MVVVCIKLCESLVNSYFVLAFYIQILSNKHIHYITLIYRYIKSRVS